MGVEQLTYCPGYRSNCIVGTLLVDSSISLEYVYDNSKPNTRGVYFGTHTIPFLDDKTPQKHISSIVQKEFGTVTKTFTPTYTGSLITEMSCDNGDSWTYTYYRSNLMQITQVISGVTTIVKVGRDREYKPDRYEVWDDTETTLLNTWVLDYSENDTLISVIHEGHLHEFSFDIFNRVTEFGTGADLHQTAYCKNLLGGGSGISRVATHATTTDGRSYTFYNNTAKPRVPEYTTWMLPSTLLPFDMNTLADENGYIQHVDAIDLNDNGAITPEFVIFTYSPDDSRVDRIDFNSGESIVYSYNGDNEVTTITVSTNEITYNITEIANRIALIDDYDFRISFSYTDNIVSEIKEETKTYTYDFNHPANIITDTI